MRSPGAVNPRVASEPPGAPVSPSAAAGGLHHRSKPRSRPGATKPEATREAHSPCRPRRPDPSPSSGTSLVSGAPRAASDLPAAARPHSLGRILLLSGALRPPCTSTSSPAPPQPPELSKPLVFVLSLRRPQGAVRVTPRGGILGLLSGSGKRVPAPSLSSQPLLAPSVPLGIAEPGSRTGSGIWIPAPFQDGTGREQR